MKERSPMKTRLSLFVTLLLIQIIQPTLFVSSAIAGIVVTEGSSRQPRHESDSSATTSEQQILKLWMAYSQYGHAAYLQWINENSGADASALEDTESQEDSDNKKEEGVAYFTKETTESSDDDATSEITIAPSPDAPIPFSSAEFSESLSGNNALEAYFERVALSETLITEEISSADDYLGNYSDSHTAEASGCSATDTSTQVFGFMTVALVWFRRRRHLG